MAKKKNNLIQYKECHQLGLNFWECPTTMFLFFSVLTAISLVATYFISSYYSSPEMAIVSLGLVTSVMMIINFSIHHGVSKAAESKRSLEDSNRKLEIAIQKVKEAEKAKEEFMYLIIHDLRSPLNGIRMLSEMMLSNQAKIKNQAKKESIRLVNHSANQMLSLVNDLLDFSKLEAGKFRVKKTKQNIADTLERMVSFYLPMADSKGIKMIINAAPNLPEIQFDQPGIEQVLHNLLSNALKFTARGQVVIDTFLHKKNNELQAESKMSGNYWQARNRQLNKTGDSIVVAVSDTGFGISPENQKKLFQKYAQADGTQIAKQKGTGLGLYIFKGIVEAHGGLIGLESKKDKGSTFYFTLPLKN